MRELSRPVKLALVGTAGRAERIVASPAECAALAVRFGIPSVERLEANLRLLPDVDGAVRVSGRLVAAVVQCCVVSLEPVAQSLAETVLWRLLPPGREPADGPDEPDEIPTLDGVADLGEALAEQLSLALDPYPRAAGAAMPDVAAATQAGPFGTLSRLRPHG